MAEDFDWYGNFTSEFYVDACNVYKNGLSFKSLNNASHADKSVILIKVWHILYISSWEIVLTIKWNQFDVSKNLAV